jgi:hypothetical protein
MNCTPAVTSALSFLEQCLKLCVLQGGCFAVWRAVTVCIVCDTL